jgi:hypothetical protein
VVSGKKGWKLAFFRNQPNLWFFTENLVWMQKGHFAMGPKRDPNAP